MTNNSLAANQRPHISLIDRRHFDDAALPMRFYVNQKHCKSDEVLGPLQPVLRRPWALSAAEQHAWPSPTLQIQRIRIPEPAS